MQIIYPLGKGSQWYDYEILYSIRSLVKHTQNPEILIIGERPIYFDYDNVNHLNFTENSHREKNIWDKVYFACKCNTVSERFLFINDDHFFLQDVDIENYPYYHDGKIEKKGWLNEIHRNPYFLTVSRTLSLLRELKLPTYYFDIHTPMIIEKEKFIRCYDYFFKYIDSGASLLLKSTYCNFNGIEGEFMDDCKIKARFDYGQIVKMTSNKHVFSVGDRACSGALKKFMDEKYPVKYAIFEKEALT